jgi:hypothetical protein
MPLNVVCPWCGSKVRVAEQDAGKKVHCPECRGVIFTAAPAQLPPAHSTEEPAGRVPLTYPQMRRALVLIQLRQRVRALCDAIHLGPSTGERVCCALIVAVMPFTLSFALSIAVHEPPLYAVLQGVGAFLIVATVLSLLVTVGGDGALESRRAEIVRVLPRAEAAWGRQRAAEQDERERLRLQREVAAEVKAEERERVRREKEEAAAPWVTPAESAPARHRAPSATAPEVHVHVHRPGRSGGVAAVLEVIFGLFLATFGIGHIYAGNVGTGLFLMFGWWLFVAANVALTFITCGIWGAIALVLLPACWFILLIVSPLMAASSVR